MSGIVSIIEKLESYDYQEREQAFLRICLMNRDEIAIIIENSKNIDRDVAEFFSSLINWEIPEDKDTYDDLIGLEYLFDHILGPRERPEYLN